jgi:hypothetical protein
MKINMDKPTKKNILRFNKDGHADVTQLFTGQHIEMCRTDDGGEEDLCNVCQEDLFFSSEATKRIAILDGELNEVAGWVCPACFTEFDNKDNILVLMSRSPIQGKS